MDSKDKRSGTVVAPAAFFGRTFDEALALTREARDYLRDYGEEDSRDLALEITAHFSVETMRLTSPDKYDGLAVGPTSRASRRIEPRRST